VENISTLAEINSTVQENNMPIGSAISVNIIGVEAVDIITHSSKIICWELRIEIVGHSIRSRIIHKKDLDVLNN
jgi:hypothetical protein